MSNIKPSEGLSEFRKSLHSLLHSNDNKPINQKARTVNTTSLSTKNKGSFHLSSTLDSQSKQKKEELKRNREHNMDIKESQNIIEVKNKKILSLNKSNLEKSEKIKELNEKLDKLEQQNTEKGERIVQLEKLILEMQKLNASTSKFKERKTTVISDSDESDYEDESIKFNCIENNEGYDLSTTNFLNPSPSDADKSINLDTQQLMNLDLKQLVIKDNDTSIYNSYKLDGYSKDHDDSDIEEYLFAV